MERYEKALHGRTYHFNGFDSKLVDIMIYRRKRATKARFERREAGRRSRNANSVHFLRSFWRCVDTRQYIYCVVLHSQAS